MTTGTLTLAAFLSKVLDELEEAASEAASYEAEYRSLRPDWIIEWCWSIELTASDGIGMAGRRFPGAPSPARVLADVAAKRKVMELHEIVPADVGFGQSKGFGCVTCDWDRDYGIAPTGGCDTLRALASVYATHPSFNPDWLA